MESWLPVPSAGSNSGGHDLHINSVHNASVPLLSAQAASSD